MKLAPDSGSARSGRDLASARRWLTLGADDGACWGECQGSGSVPYQTQIDLSEPAFKCSCPSRKFPCKHALGLFLLLAEARDAFNAAARPGWVEDWLAGRARRAEERTRKVESPAAEQPGPVAAADTEARAKRATAREAKVAGGLEELKRWMLDLVRQGLASAQGRPYSFWESVAARMVDAQAPGVARLVREMAGIPASGADWPDRLLERLGRLLLLIEGYSRIASLPETTQADLRSLIGWTQDQKQLLERPGIADRWQVLGRRVEVEDRLKVQRTWLWGRSSRRAALVLHFAVGNQPLDVSLVPGTEFDAELVFFPSSLPLRALVKLRHESAGAIGSVSGQPAFGGAVSAHVAALAENPWIELFPMVLNAVIPLLRQGCWFIHDREHHLLPLAPRSDHGWRLLACSGGRPIGLFCEYDGETLRPLSLWNEGGFQSLPDVTNL